MINLHRGYCRYCGPSVFNRHRCFICGNPARPGEADIHVKVRRCRVQHKKLEGTGAEGRPCAAPSANMGNDVQGEK